MSFASAGVTMKMLVCQSFGLTVLLAGLTRRLLEGSRIGMRSIDHEIVTRGVKWRVKRAPCCAANRVSMSLV